MEAVKSGYSEVEVVVRLEAGKEAVDISMSLAGDFQVPDRNQATLTLSSGGIDAEFEMITIGRKSYMTNPVTGEWAANPELPVPFGNEMLAFGAFDTDLDPAVVEDFVLVGEEELDGERVYHLGGPVPGTTLADLLDDPGVEGGEGEVEYWIGVKDLLVRRTAVELEVLQDDPITGEAIMLKMTAVATLSDYGKPVDIQEPEVEDYAAMYVEDDHGDYAEWATDIAVDEVVEGAVDSIDDFDYFRFRAEEGQGYEIRVDLGTLEDSGLTLYSPYGDEEAWSDDYEDTLASRITWVAPSSDEYYILVESFDGTGTYTLTITPSQ